MKKKVEKAKAVKPGAQKSKSIKPLKDELTMAVHNVLNNNKLELPGKVEKLVKKTIKTIVKKTAKQVKKLSKELSNAN